MTLKAVLFDVDGVLLDSRAALVGNYTSSLVALGLGAPSAKEILAHDGLAAHAWINALIPEAATDVRAAVANRAEETYAHFITDFAKPIPDALTLVKHLKKRGVKVGVVTNQNANEIAASLNLLHVEFDHLSFLQPGMRPKPEPDLVLDALKNLGVNASEAVMIGDSPADFGAARAAGVTPLLRFNQLTAGLDAKKFVRFSDAYEQLFH